MAKIPLGNDIDLDDSQFYNRVNDISFLYNHLKTTEDGSSPAILLTGVRGVGKTVLMKKLIKDYCNDYLIVYINLENCDKYDAGELTRFSIMKVFYDAIITSCENFGFMTSDIKTKKFFKTKNFKIDNIVDYKDIPVPIPHSEDDYSKFADFVTSLPMDILNQYNHVIKGVWIFFDEFQIVKHLNTDVNSFLWYIRGLVQSQKGVGYMFSGSMSVKDELTDDISGRRGAFGGRILTFELQPFSFETTKNFLTENADYLKFTGDGFEQFYEYTGGIPYYVNSFARLLPPNRVLDKKQIISEFNSSLDYLVSNSKRIWYSLTPQEQKIVTTLVEKPLRRVDIAKKLNITSGAIGNSLNSLIDSVLIEGDGKYFNITDNIFRAWLKNEYDRKGVFPFKNNIY